MSQERVFELTYDSWMEYKREAKLCLGAGTQDCRIEMYEDAEGAFLHWLEQDRGGNFLYMVCRIRRK